MKNKFAWSRPNCDDRWDWRHPHVKTDKEFLEEIQALINKSHTEARALAIGGWVLIAMAIVGFVVCIYRGMVWP